MFLTINVKSLTSSLTSWGMFILFPGFMLYHMLLAIDIIPPILGGLFGPISMVYFIIHLILCPFNYRKILNKSPVYYVSTIGFFIYSMFWILAHYIAIDEPYIQIASVQALTTLIIWVALFFIGIHFSYENKIIEKLFLLFFIAAIIFLIYFTLATGNVMFYASEFHALEDYSGVSTYQGFARSALVIGVLLLCYKKNPYKRILIMIFTLFILFFLGARSELYGFVLLLVILFVANSIKSVRWSILSIGVIASVVLLVLSNIEWLSESRQFEIINLSQSTSMMGRLEYQEVALKQIEDNPVIGYYGGHIVDTGSIGGYAHNALSAWLTYGVFGFIIYVTLTAIATLNSFYYFIKYRTLSSHWTFAFTINCFCLLMMITSKSVYWILPALGWGLYINAMARHQS